MFFCCKSQFCLLKDSFCAYSGKFSLFNVWDMPVLIYIYTYTVLWNKISQSCWFCTLHDPVEGSPAGRKKQFGFTSLPDDNGGKKLFLLISSKHLAKTTYILTHWKTVLKNMHHLDLIILLGNRNFTNFGQISVQSFDDSWIMMVIAVVIFCLLFLVSEVLMWRWRHSWIFYNECFQLENTQNNWKKPSFYVYFMA